MLISVGLMMMFIKDAGDVRHAYRRILGTILVGETGYSLFGIAFEVFYFSIIGIIMLVALVAYRTVYWNNYQQKNIYL